MSKELEQISNALKVGLILKFERCKSREHLDSCEPYQDINIKSACQRTLSKFKAWSAFVEKMEPSLGCPLLKGTYSCQNGTFDGIALAVLPIEGWYWKVRAFVYEEGVKNSGPIMCVYVEGEIVNV
ncbi:hypothetical protein PPYR_05714 [Photinus pyralis]|uniref:MD-2-related lipid-recognition domain-containing protein n=1 Tax=Photinus pyralis TaxID=7054 RepID=A0A5N4AVV4_PHOPY|nr:hypothetical protein PPYR_05714 [Photinus pyralis]